MSIGSVLTLFVVPVFYSLIAAQHRPQTDDAMAEVPLNAQQSPA